ncbi:MopE-related protein [Anaeromyxobacter oryzae]|uniref:IPT/TIG domain-containing protein n=1 Tax=Anaeromyxobacter oryzae TaxID=2918170 RepID=A0ABN6MQH6_9BACT|nr:MopE-related protein [Anaeromyxobacter oryzae]BDG01875.1 hypothetical protein AMOR_08710 [Anaeromyxobacter oryzae]
MNPARPTVRRRLVARLFPLLVALGALPLLAPTCDGSQPGLKTFSRGSLIIPMDVCYQYMTDGVKSGYTPFACPQAPDPGDVIKAYGLVYQLIRNNIAVYWVINPTKTAVTGTDLAIQYDGGFPVLRYDWASGGSGTAPTAQHVVRYLGGPFVVDGTDAARASQVLQQYKATFGAVRVHVSNVAFQGNVAKTMAGGWSAGGTVPPKLALLDIGSSGAGAKNSEIVIQGYLQRAGLDTPGAAGTATGTHGQIYDRLFMSDFLPDASGDWKTTNLYKNGYQVLWVPHWAAPSSCSDCPPGASCTCANKYSAATIAQALQTIGAFSVAGKDVFAECAGLGSFEGVFSSTSTTSTYGSTYQSGAANTHFETQAPTGFWINKTTSSAYLWGNFASPLMQLGDYPFIPRDGAIQNFKASAYKAETTRLISDSTDNTYDIFTLVPGTAAHGTVVYLGGHSYSGSDGAFEVGGSRLVLNTLFNLGASCVASGVACNTGKLGVCAQGVMACDAQGQAICKQVTAGSAEICDGLDNDCNGLVDDGLDEGCYDGPVATRNVGLCRDGVRSCSRRADGSYAMSACTGQLLPSDEVCNGLDDNCNGKVDEDPVDTTKGLSQACYTGPTDTVDPATGVPLGICKAGLQSCSAGTWGACQVCGPDAWTDRSNPAYASCEILPQAELCQADGAGNQVDMNCNGAVAETCGCVPETSKPQSCYDGPPATAGVGSCRKGTQTCVAVGQWSACQGEVLPQKEICGNGVDDDCNGIVDDPVVCNTCPAPADPARVCYVNADHSAPQGLCANGVRSCADGILGACEQMILPAPEICDGKDNNCDGQVDENPDTLCMAGFTCVHGVCIPRTCGVESPCPDGYACQGGACVRSTCNGATCADGQICEFGACVDPCASVKCGAGSTCASGACSGGGCYFTGCDPGLVCRNGACEADPCAALTCPSGTFCRAGDCVQACTFVTCAAGQRCGGDGFCVPDLCTGKSCPPEQTCVDGTCQADPCLGIACGQGQVCDGGSCVDDPCAAITCPAGQCLRGQCYAAGTLTASPKPDEPSSSGCGCGSGAGSPLSALLLLLAAPLARRRRRPAGGGRATGVLAVLLLATALIGAGCQKASDPFDPTKCAETCGEQRCVDVLSDPVHCGRCETACGAGQICVDATCGPATAVAPFIKAVTPAAAAKGSTAPVALTGERFADGATLRLVSPRGTSTVAAQVQDAGHLTAVLDLSDSPTTSLDLRVVNPDHVISNAAQFDVITPTPIVNAVTPATISAGAAQSLAVTGSGFMPASQCRVKGARLAEQALPTTPASGTALTCTFDTAGLAPGAYELWVVNEGTLASNHFALAIQSATPHLDAVNPSTGQPGAVVALSVVGTGFDLTSAVLFDGTAQPTTYLDPGHLLVQQLTLPACASTCSSSVAVRNASVTSNTAPFVVAATAPKADNLSVAPSPLYQGDTATLTFTGSGLASATGISVLPPVGAALAASLSGTPTATEVKGTLSLSGTPDGLYSAQVVFPGGVTSSSFQFRVLSNVAVLRSATPAGGKQGDVVSTTLTASNLREPRASIRVVFQGPGAAGPARTLVPTSFAPAAPSLPTTVVVPLDLRGFETGTYALSVVNPGAAASNAVSFSVTPGPPTITAVSPACLVQSDSPATVTITGTNFAADASGAPVSQVMITSTALGGSFVALPASAVVTVKSATEIQVLLDTRDAVVDPSAGYTIYGVAVWNPPGPQQSNSDRSLKIGNACP